MYWSLENVPWTNLHDLNLDWIVNTMKQTVEQWIAYRTEMNQNYAVFTENIEQDFSELQQYVHDYFDNLDLNESTRYVINQMIESGEFIEVLNPSIVASVSAWLDQHVTPTSPVVDDTLTISGAAADAKTTGDRFTSLNQNLTANYLHFNLITETTAQSEYNNLASNIPINTYSFVSPAWFNDMAGQTGVHTSGVLFYVAQTSAIGRTQIFVQIDGCIVTRYAPLGSDFDSWKEISLLSTISDNYNATITYKRGDYCVRNGVVYRCIASTTGAFVANKWYATNIASELVSRCLRNNFITESRAASEYNNIASNIPYNTFSFISASWFTDMSAVSGNGYIFYVAGSETVGRTQIFITISGDVAVRYAGPTAETFGDWTKLPSFNNLAPPYDESANYVRGDFCYYHGTIYICTGNTTGTFNSTRWSSISIMSNAKNALRLNSITEARAGNEYNNLASTLPINTFSFISASWFSDMNTVSGSGIILYLAQSANIGRTQVYIQNNGNIFTRYASPSKAFGEWKNVNDYVNATFDTTAHYYAYGDSTTKGQIGTWSGETAGTSIYNYPTIAAKRLNMIIHNQAVGGQGLCTDYATIIDSINSTTFESNTRLVTVGWAYNDTSTYATLDFGTYDDTTTTTVIGRYYNVMKLLQEKNPNAQLVLITGYGYPGGNASEHIYANLLDQFTHNYTFRDGNKTVKTFYDTLEAMCNLHGWSCINQAKGSAFNEFNASNVFGDNVHPTNAGYKIYSNFLTAKIASVFANVKF